MVSVVWVLVLLALPLPLACLVVKAMEWLLPLKWTVDRTRELERQQVTATVIPNRAAPPPKRVAVSFWEPRPVKGEIER